MLHPQNKDGFIDYDTVFKLVVGKLNKPISYLDDLTVHEINMLAEQQQEDQEENYEMIALAVQLGYVNANTKGKNQTLFDKKKSQNNKVTKEQKEKEVNELKKIFNID